MENLRYQEFASIDILDPFFDSLKEDYAEFSNWFDRKSKQGECAYVFYAHDRIDGFLYLKIEEEALDDINPPLPPAKRLKVGTLKINAHGTKLGERFIKKIFDHAIEKEVSEIYLTVFAKHQGLITLLERYGFRTIAEKSTPNGTEGVMLREIFCPLHEDTKKHYPLVNTCDQNCYGLSLYPQWHTRLLPDSILKNEDSSIVQDISPTNSIHKVYLAGMRGMDLIKSGDVLMIYRTSDSQGPAEYRSVATSLCVVEEYKNIREFVNKKDFLSYCRPYSIFSEKELESMWSKKRYPHVLRFSYNIAFKKRITRHALIEQIGLERDMYWGFFPITQEQLQDIAKLGQINENLIIY